MAARSKGIFIRIPYLVYHLPQLNEAGVHEVVHIIVACPQIQRRKHLLEFHKALLNEGVDNCFALVVDTLRKQRWLVL